MKSFENKFKRVGQKTIVPLIWFAIALLLLATIFIAQHILTKPLNENSIVLIPSLFFILYFIWILFVSITKYRKETLLDNTERKAKWQSLGLKYKRFYRHMYILGISLSIFMFISGIWFLIIKNPSGWLMLILGINVMISNIIISRRNKKMISKK